MGQRSRATRKVPSRTSQRLSGLRLFERRTATMKGSKNPHSASDIQLRAKIVSPADTILNHT